MGLGSFCSRKNNNLITLQPKSLRITGAQKGFVQYLEIYQSIQAEEDLSELSYIFPTDNNLCIYGMKFQVGDETINAELRSQQAAEETFKEARRTGRTAAMTEQVSPGITSIKIGNVPKDKIVAIIFQCAFTSILQNPTTILTKIPLQASEPDGSTTDLYSIPSLEITVDLSISQLEPISDVYTNCESNYEKIDDCNGKLTINSALITDENILIMTEFSNPVQSQLIQEKNTAVISIIPQYETEKNALKEYVFLIDCSASMIGESIRKAKESLQLFLSKIPDGSYFNIIRFGTKYDKLFEHSSQKVESTILEAKNFIEKIRANLGGTEMYSLLDDLFKDEVKTAAQRQIFLITDGEVYERQKVTQKISENSGFNRIFAIGLGHGADAGFLDEITSITNGKADYVFNPSELPSKVEEQLDLSQCEALTQVAIHVAENDSIECVPFPIPPLLPGVVSHLFALSGEEKDFDGVIVTGKLRETAEIENVVSLTSKIEPSNLNGAKNPVFALFAWHQLKRIKDDEKKSVELSMSSGVLCSFTSYVAVSEKSKVSIPSSSAKDEEECEAKFDKDAEMCEDMCYHEAEMCKAECCYDEVEMCDAECCYDEKPLFAPVKKSKKRKMAKKGKSRKMKSSRLYDDDDDGPEFDIECKMCAPVKMASFGSFDDACNACEKDADKTKHEEKTQPDSFEPVDVKVELDSSKIWKAESQVAEIIRLQSRDGFWDLPSIFISEKYSGKLPDVNGVDLSESPIVKKRVISTVFTIAYLVKFYGESPGKWRFAKEKGIKWLKRIESSANWDQIIAGIIPDLIK